jgi:hypothetical protein
MSGTGCSMCSATQSCETESQVQQAPYGTVVLPVFGETLRIIVVSAPATVLTTSCYRYSTCMVRFVMCALVKISSTSRTVRYLAAIAMI